MQNQINQLLQEQGDNVADSLRDTFLGLFPSWPTLLTTFLCFIVLMTAAYKLVWQPVRKMMAERRALIQKNIDDSIVNFEESKKKKEEAYNFFEEYRLKAHDQISNAKVEIERMKIETINTAQRKANRMITEAEAEITAERTKLRRAIKAEMVEIALEAAKKIVQKEMDNDKNRLLIEEFINEELRVR